ncbi:MAG: ABC transporter permease [Spirochaetota bacterium]
MKSSIRPVMLAAIGVLAFAGSWLFFVGEVFGLFLAGAAWLAYMGFVLIDPRRSEKHIPLHTPLLRSVTVVLGAVGLVLYFGGYFWGGLILIAALIAVAVEKGLSSGGQSLSAALKSAGKRLTIPLLGLLLALIIGMIIMLITGFNPIESYRALFYGGLIRNWSVSVLNATPLIFTGLSVAFAFQAGLFNIGAEGQYYIGAMAATFLGLTLDLPLLVTVVLIFILGGAASAAWNFVPALLKVKTGAHEVITTMMLAHTARYLSPVFIRAFGGDPATSTHAYVTDTLPQSSWLPNFKTFLPEANYRLNIGILIGILFALGVYYILYKTRIGFEIRAVGHNKEAARAQGISVGKNIFRALLGAGALSGTAGIVQVIGLDHKLFLNLEGGYGWNGIAVALLASNNPIGVIFTALLWGVLDAGGQYMVRVTDTPNSIVEIIKGIILFLIVARYIYTYWGDRIRRKRRRGAEERDRSATTEGGMA